MMVLCDVWADWPTALRRASGRSMRLYPATPEQTLSEDIPSALNQAINEAIKPCAPFVERVERWVNYRDGCGLEDRLYWRRSETAGFYLCREGALPLS